MNLIKKIKHSYKYYVMSKKVVDRLIRLDLNKGLEYEKLDRAVLWSIIYSKTYNEPFCISLALAKSGTLEYLHKQNIDSIRR